MCCRVLVFVLEVFGMLLKKIKPLLGYFTIAEITLWSVSAVIITVSFFIFDRENYLTLTASLIGVTSLIFNAKGNAFGQFLMIIFSILYGIISFTFSYYGEMVTYLGMTAPMAFVSLISWLKNPCKGRKAEVKINRLKLGEVVFAVCLTAAVTFIFYFILKKFHTANIELSTLSVATSFIAVYMTFKRSIYCTLCYAANDIVLIAMWISAMLCDISYSSVVICFVIFLVNDIYGFINWSKMRKRQESE